MLDPDVALASSFQSQANVQLNSTLDQRVLHSLPNESHILMLDSVSHWTQHEGINTVAPIDSEGMIVLISTNVQSDMTLVNNILQIL